MRATAGTSADVHLAFSGRHVSAHGRGELAGLGFVEVPSAELDLDGPPTAAAFARATGFVDLRGTIDLANVAIPSDDVEQLGGSALVEARIERYDGHALPAIRGSVTTRDLEIALAGRAPIQGIEVQAHAAWDGRTEDGELALLTWDRHGVLTSGNAKARLPLLTLFQGKRKAFLDALTSTSLSGVIDVPTRSIESIPPFLVPPGIAGRVDARARFSGELAAPEVAFVAHGGGLRERGIPTGRERYEPIDAVLQGHWDGNDLVAVLSADERAAARGRSRPELRAPLDARDRSRDRNRGSGRVRAMMLGRLSARDLLAMGDGKDPQFLLADAEIEVEDLELSPIPLQSRMRGALTGRATLHDLGGSPSVNARAHVDRFAVSGARVDALDLDVKAHDGSLVASARAIDAGKNVLAVTVDFTPSSGRA
jgi:hypothetical protein